MPKTKSGTKGTKGSKKSKSVPVQESPVQESPVQESAPVQESPVQESPVQESEEDTSSSSQQGGDPIVQELEAHAASLKSLAETVAQLRKTVLQTLTHYRHHVKSLGKKTKKTSSVKRPQPRYLLKPAMASFMKTDSATRGEIMKAVSTYVSSNNLKNTTEVDGKVDRKVFNLDKQLRKLFKGHEQLRYTELMGVISPHLDGKVSV